MNPVHSGCYEVASNLHARRQLYLVTSLPSLPVKSHRFQCAQAQGELPKQRFTVPHQMAWTACLPHCADPEAGSIQALLGSLAARAQFELLQTSQDPADRGRRPDKVKLLPRHHVLTM